MLTRNVFIAFVALTAFVFSTQLTAQATDPDTIWPLCGRITENPPPGWQASDGCPAVRFGDPAYSDAPFSATFGPRPLGSENDRYDFHRGVDIATPSGTPLFAITDGEVGIAGDHASFSDPLIKLRHLRPGSTSCSDGGGCYHSYYMHISDWVVSAGETVQTGQLIGFSGASGASGFQHVHFEVRDAPDFDVLSAWSRDAIHPFGVVPYLAANNTTVFIDGVNTSDPNAVVAGVAVTSNRYDLVSVEMKLYDSQGLEIPQAGSTEVNGYHVLPPFFDMESWGFQYSHKDSTAFPWVEFGADGLYECPYNADHTALYSPHIHMDAQVPGNGFEGLFNGVHITTSKYWLNGNKDYSIQLEFLNLTGAADCIEASAVFASGDISTSNWGNCGAPPPNPPSVVTRGPYLQQQTNNSIIVRWRTDVATDSEVRFGTDSAALISSSVDADLTTEHTVRLSGLSEATQYFYSIGNTTTSIAGDSSYHFQTSPSPGAPAATRFWVIGDSGTANSNANAVRDAYKTWSSSRPANFMLMLGDNAYNDGTDAEYQNAVFDTYPELLRQLPVWPTLGNHDGHSADSATQSGPYYDIFDLPTAAEVGGLASGTEAYYAFDYANIHFVVMDSYETDRSPAGNMLQWLESDLAINDKPWVIAFFHHPPYTKGSHNSDTEGRLIDMRQNALPILEAWGVDLVMSGHSHSYERSFLLDGHYGDSSTLDIAVNILDMGDGSEGGDGVYEKPDMIAAQSQGAIYTVAGSSGKVSNATLNHPAMITSLASLGSMVVDVTGNRLDLTFLDQNALVQDQFTIMKTPDIEAPLITAAAAEDATHVLVEFSEKLDMGGANDAMNYAITGLLVNAVELLAGNKTVRLTTSVMTAGNSYLLTVNDVMDERGNFIAVDSQVSFEFNPVMTKSFQNGLLPNTNYVGNKDTYIREATATTNFGADVTLQVDGSEPSGTETDMSIVIAWDVSDIPATATVNAVNIHFNTLNVGGPYSCYGLLRSWNENEASWNNASTGFAWSSPGALGVSDRGIPSLCNFNAASTGPIAIGLNADGLALVQSWVDGTTDNNGIIIADPVTSNGADFDSSESADAMNRPKLEVIYTVPVTPGNSPPVASFSDNCNKLECGFTDSSSDADGTISAWSWSFGDGLVSSLQHPVHTYSAAGTYAVELTVTDNDGASDAISMSVTVSEPAQFVDYQASGQISVSGTVSGGLLEIQSDDDVTQSIRERESGGKKQNRHSFLEHKWTFDVASAASFVFSLNAWSSQSSDSDRFEFAWSRDDITYTRMFEVPVLDSANVQFFVLPSDLSGTVFIQVKDTDRSTGNRALDRVFIDYMNIHAEKALGVVPEAPSGLTAGLASTDSIALSWSDNASDELGFELEQSTDQSNWTALADPGVNAQNAAATGLDPLTTYYYQIRAFNLSGSSLWSNVAAATTGEGPPPPPISLSLEGSKNRGKHVIDLLWSGTTASQVDIYRDTDSPVTVSNEGPDMGKYTDVTTNKGGRTYTYKVCEANTSICSADEKISF